MAADATSQLVERERGRLFGVAYRLLGTVPDAEDAVQETFLRWAQADHAAVANPAGWLTTVLTRHCLDQLRSARARHEAYVGTWLPDPLLRAADPAATDPAEQVALDESVSLAMLVVLETLSPAERAVFVLHDVFGMDFDDVGAAGGRPPASVPSLVPAPGGCYASPSRCPGRAAGRWAGGRCSPGTGRRHRMKGGTRPNDDDRRRPPRQRALCRRLRQGRPPAPARQAPRRARVHGRATGRPPDPRHPGGRRPRHPERRRRCD